MHFSQSGYKKMKSILLILVLIISTYTQCQELVWQSYNVSFTLNEFKK